MNQHTFNIAAQVLVDSMPLDDLPQANHILTMMYVTAEYTNLPPMVVAKAFAAIRKVEIDDPIVAEIGILIMSKPDALKKYAFRSFIQAVAARYE